MRYGNFEYDSLTLGDFGCVTGSFDSDALTTNSEGNRLTFDTATFANVDKFRLLNPTYEQPYTHNFQIVRSSCDTNGRFTFSRGEANAILRWLNRKEYHKFLPLDKSSNYTGFYYNATFNVGEISLMGEIVGFDLTLVADAPFGYYDDVVSEQEINADKYLYINDSSEEIRKTYPTVQLTTKQAGNIVLHNSASTKDTVVNNCIAGETITFYGDTKIIKSNKDHKKLYNDFNYVFPTVVNSVDKNGVDVRENRFTCSIGCIMKIIYTPVCKIGLG